MAVRYSFRYSTRVRMYIVCIGVLFRTHIRHRFSRFCLKFVHAECVPHSLADTARVLIEECGRDKERAYTSYRHTVLQNSSSTLQYRMSINRGRDKERTHTSTFASIKFDHTLAHTLQHFVHVKLWRRIIEALPCERQTLSLDEREKKICNSRQL